MQRNYPPGPTEALLLQGQLFYVQEDARAEEKRTDKGIRETGEETQGFEGAWAVQETGRKSMNGLFCARFIGSMNYNLKK